VRVFPLMHNHYNYSNREYEGSVDCHLLLLLLLATLCYCDSSIKSWYCQDTEEAFRLESAVPMAGSEYPISTKDPSRDMRG
jgi:hypothetical protein